ncbi:glycerophosphodiester phosphodiesterase [Streptomyces sp. URMC 129]|uniref:glycerophosphodiester phosphodiesterase n=1 Tax=Streptomyces sp. URMC 129 TaxID=3423407 RepID=UPI003F1BBFCF
MARHLYGGVAEYVIAKGTANAAILQPGATVTCWSAESGGSQYTDLLMSDGVTPIAGGELEADATGALPEWYGPDGVTSLWLDASGGEGPRRRAAPTSAAQTAVAVAADLATHAGQRNPHATRSVDLPDLYQPSVQAMLDAMTAGTVIRIAHRGSGQEFPEHTLVAYKSALAAGAEYIEVSVRLTADGVLVCHHDDDLTRMTDYTGSIEAWTYAALREKVKVRAQGLLGSGWGDQDIPTLKEVMDALYGKCVIFLEAKSNRSAPALQNFLTRFYPGAQNSVVIKQYYQSNMLDWGAANGYKTWAYVDANTTEAQLNTYDGSRVTMWGVPHTMTNARIVDVINRGKPVICWEVHRHVDVERLTNLKQDVGGVITPYGKSVSGLMCSRWVYLNKTLAPGGSVAFSPAVCPPGILGRDGYSETHAPHFENGRVYVNVVPNRSLLLGYWRAPADSGYTIFWDMVWPTLPGGTLHSGIAVCRAWDDIYEFNGTNQDSGVDASPGGYHTVFRSDGNMRVNKHVKGSTGGVTIGPAGDTATPAPAAGQVLSFSLQVTATQLILSRLDVGPYTYTATDSAFRGRWITASTGSVSSLAASPRFGPPSFTTP